MQHIKIGDGFYPSPCLLLELNHGREAPILLFRSPFRTKSW